MYILANKAHREELDFMLFILEVCRMILFEVQNNTIGL